MALYKCGYCGKQTEGDIWCSEEHRQAWYESRRVATLEKLMRKPGRIGPKGRATGGRRRAQQARVKKS